MNYRCYMLITYRARQLPYSELSPVHWYDTVNYLLDLISDRDEVGEAGKWGIKEGNETLGCHGVLQYYRLEHNVTQGQMCSIVPSRGNCSRPIKCNFYWNVESYEPGSPRVWSSAVRGQVRAIIQCRDLMQGSVRTESRIIALLFLHNLDWERLTAY